MIMGKHFTLDDLRKTPAAKLNPHLFQEPEKKSKRAKYNNEKIEYLGEVFDSKKEYRRYRELLLLRKQGIIGQIRRQVKYLLIETAWEPIIGKRGLPLKKQKCVERKMEYWADFVYINCETGLEVVEDVKSEATRKLSTYINKRKLMLDRHGIKIKEV